MKYVIIYKTTNLINGKIYVGKHSQYICPAIFDGYLGGGILINRSIKKYGKENFVRQTLEVVEDENMFKEREIFWISRLKSTDKKVGYNITVGGEGFTSEYVKNSWENPVHRKKKEESNKKIDVIKRKSDSQKRIWSDPNNILLSERRLSGIINTWKVPESRNKILKVIRDPENRDKISKSKIRNWKDSEYRGAQIRSFNKPETLKKRSDRNVGAKNPFAIYRYTFKDSNEKIWKTDCLAEFCRQHNLKKTNIYSITRKQGKKHKGWVMISKIIRNRDKQGNDL